MIDFNHMINNYLKNESPRVKAIGRYYPSEIGLCLRKTWYTYKFPQETNPDLLKIFEMGNILHDFVVDVLKSEKNPEVELLKSEFPFKYETGDYVVSGRIDNLILVKLNGKNVLVEVKSSGNIDFVEDAMKHNIMQLQLYLHALQVEDGILLYVDKRNLKSKVFTIKYNPKAAEIIFARFAKLHEHLLLDTLPEPEARADRSHNWMCRFCEYREKCYEATPKNEKYM